MYSASNGEGRLDHEGKCGANDASVRPWAVPCSQAKVATLIEFIHSHEIYFLSLRHVDFSASCDHGSVIPVPLNDMEFSHAELRETHHQYINSVPFACEIP